MLVKWIDDTTRGKNYQFICIILDILNKKRIQGISFFKKNDRNFIYTLTDRLMKTMIEEVLEKKISN